MKMFPTPLFLREGSRWDHMMRTGLPLMTSKFMVSKARSAGSKNDYESIKMISIKARHYWQNNCFYFTHSSIWIFLDIASTSFGLIERKPPNYIFKCRFYYTIYLCHLFIYDLTPYQQQWLYSWQRQQFYDNHIWIHCLQEFYNFNLTINIQINNRYNNTYIQRQFQKSWDVLWNDKKKSRICSFSLTYLID